MSKRIRQESKKKGEKKMIDKKVLNETFADVGVGIIVSFPIAWLVLTTCTFFDLSVDKIAFIQTIVFTTISLLRKYTIRKYFKDNEESH
jgi:hypothetical protein